VLLTYISPMWPVVGSGDTTAPITVFVSETKTRVSTVTGFNVSDVTWSVDEACQAWQIREVAAANTLLGAAGQLVASGGSVPANTNQVTSISGASLSTGDGSKLLKIFAQDLAGNWST
jgi:hypothetical protein